MCRTTFLLLLLALTSPELLSGCGGSTSTAAPAVVQPRLGSYGGSEGGSYSATLLLTSRGGTLTRSCDGHDTLTQPLIVDATGHFDVTATIGGLLDQQSPGHLVGTVQGDTITLAEQLPNEPLNPPFTLVYGQAAPAFHGACPG